MEILKSTVVCDEFTDYASKVFDYEFTGTSEFVCHAKPDIPEQYNIGLIYGASGSGKSTLLKQFGTEEAIVWEKDKAIVSHFNTPEEAIDSLSSVGLNSIPIYMRPYHVLSTGEKFRADLSRRIKDNAVVDEFTSVVNRSVAKSASKALAKKIRRENIEQVVFCSCHADIVEWLQPDWVYNTDTNMLTVGRSLQPSINISIYRTTWDTWDMFKQHHYLSADLNKACHCYVGVWENKIIAFNASMSLPGKIPMLYQDDIRKKFRESRTVILPDYQGIGIGTRFSDAIAQIYLDSGYRYFSKTAHVRMGEYRQKVDVWRPTSTNLKSREKSQQRSKKQLWHHLTLDTKRLCYSHEYIGVDGEATFELLKQKFEKDTKLSLKDIDNNNDKQYIVDTWTTWTKFNLYWRGNEALL